MLISHKKNNQKTECRFFTNVFEKNERYFNDNCLDSDFLLTMFDITLIRECANLLVVASVPFSSFAYSHNTIYGYAKVEEICVTSGAASPTT